MIQLKNKQVKFGKVHLHVNKSADPQHDQFVPKGNKYVDHDKMLETLAHAIEADKPVLLIGETGTGKTSAVRYLAQETGNAFRRLNLNGATTVDEFVGKILIDEKGTYWTDGILVDAMRNGHWLLIDEINAGLPEILFVLQSLLDDDKYIVLSDKKDREIVRPHPNFRLFATCNPSDNYSGTKEMNKALLSRFPIVLEIGFPTPDKELDVMKSKFKSVNEDLASRMIDMANDLRNGYKEHKMDFCFSTRELINWYEMQEFTGGDVKLAAKYTILGKCNKTDKEVIEQHVQTRFKAIEKEYDGDLKVGTVIRAEANIVPYSTKDTVPAGSVLRVIKSPWDRGGNIGMTVMMKLERPGAHDPSKISLPKKPDIVFKLDDLSGRIRIEEATATL